MHCLSDWPDNFTMKLRLLELRRNSSSCTLPSTQVDPIQLDKKLSEIPVRPLEHLPIHLLQLVELKTPGSVDARGVRLDAIRDQLHKCEKRLRKSSPDLLLVSGLDDCAVLRTASWVGSCGLQ
jgi:hypothetical protein